MHHTPIFWEPGPVPHKLDGTRIGCKLVRCTIPKNESNTCPSCLTAGLFTFQHCSTLRLDTSALADHPDPYPRVFSALNAALGSSWVCSHGYSQVYTTILTITTPSVTTTTTITTKRTKQKRNGRVGVKVRPFCSSFFILQ